jgi:hypothetical protein
LLVPDIKSRTSENRRWGEGVGTLNSWTISCWVENSDQLWNGGVWESNKNFQVFFRTDMEIVALKSRIRPEDNVINLRLQFRWGGNCDMEWSIGRLMDRSNASFWRKWRSLSNRKWRRKTTLTSDSSGDNDDVQSLIR